MTSHSGSDIPLQSPKAPSNKRKAKTRIYKTYHHDICVTYSGLLSTSDLTLEDSDPEETQHMLSNMIHYGNDRQPYSPPGGTGSDRVGHTKYSTGGLSTVDSGVVSHDSLLDRYREMSVSRSERSESPCSPYSTLNNTQSGSGRDSSRGRSEFDPLNRPILLDSKLRSRSRNRLEEEQQMRGKSPRRSHGVKQMINFFEGSQEDLLSTPQSSTGSTSNLTRAASTNLTRAASTSLAGAANPDSSHTPPTTTHYTKHSRSEPPPIKQALYTSPIRLAKKRNSRFKQGSVGNEDGTVGSTPTRAKQDSSLHLTCVASGYSKYSPYSERKSYHTEIESEEPDVMSHSPRTECIDSPDASSNHKVNGAIKEIDNGVTHTTHISDGSDTLPNGSSPTDNTNSNNHVSPATPSDTDIITSDSVKLELIDQDVTDSPLTNGHEVELSLDVKTTPVSIDAVDRSVAPTTDEDIVIQPIGNRNSKSQPIDDVVTTDQPSVSLLTNGIDGGVQDSPSKKNGEWFLKVTYNVQSRLLELCDVASKDLDDDSLPEEVSGQIRAAIGKAQLLVNKKFKQFRGLCEKNLTQSEDEQFPTTSQDLAGFWDMVYIQVEQCENNFSDIATLRSAGWVPDTKVDKPEVAPVTPRKPTTPRSHVSGDGTVKSEQKPKSKPGSAAKARDEARKKRLMAAKKAMKERRNSETDDVIYVPSS